VTLPPLYQFMVIGVSALLVAIYVVIGMRAARDYHAYHDARAAWALAARIAALVACVGLLVSGLGFVVPVPDGQGLANFGLGITRSGLFAAGVALLVQGSNGGRGNGKA
jgi:hypothetical protein